MKVILVSRLPRDTSAPRGGVESVTLALTRALCELDDLEVHVVALDPASRTLLRTQLGRATVHRLPGSRVPQMLDVLGGPGRARLHRYLLGLRPDIVHFHETYGYGGPSLGLPVVFTIHGFDHANIPAERRRAGWLRAPLWKAVEAWGLRRQRHVIAITPYVREHLDGRTTATIHDIENPLDPAYFEIPRKTVPGRVLFAGWITPRKNPLALVNAIGLVRDDGVEAALHLAGEPSDAAYAETVRAAISRLGLADRVELLGRVSPERIRSELSAAAAFVLPSLQENAPMAISEALAAGVPVIASNLCGMPHMIVEGRTGYLVDPQDVRGIADRLVRLLKDDRLQREMGEAAHASALERFHPKAVAAKTRAVYEQVIREHQLARA
jgi:glycosyltransferase involved in cell wall biosynthesis